MSRRRLVQALLFLTIFTVVLEVAVRAALAWGRSEGWDRVAASLSRLVGAMKDWSIRADLLTSPGELSFPSPPGRYETELPVELIPDSVAQVEVP